MQLIRVPLSDLICYLEGSINTWPRGHVVPEQGPLRNKMLVKASAEFAKAYILSSMRHVRKKADPVEVLLAELGYPTTTMSVEALDALAAEVDDYYLTLVLFFDPLVEAISTHLDRKSVTFEVPANSEDLMINIEGDVLAVRYRDAIAQLHQLTPPKPPKVPYEEGDLEPYEQYIQHVLAQTFNAIPDELTRGMVKNIYLEALKRY